jgi:beta-glucosidase
VKDAEHAVACCLEGGCDINSGNTYAHNLASSITNNVTNIVDARAALTNAFKVRFRLGLFDPHVDNKNKQIPKEVIGSVEHHEASAMTSRQSMILLKNEKDTLPLKPGSKIALIGTSSGSLMDLLGEWAPQVQKLIQIHTHTDYCLVPF